MVKIIQMVTKKMDKCFDSHAGVTGPVWKFLRLEREELEGGGGAGGRTDVETCFQ